MSGLAGRLLPRRLPYGRALVWLALVALAAYPFVVRDNLYAQNVLILTFLLAVMSSGWNLISGFAGYVSLGQSAFLGIGAYTTAILALRFGLPPFAMVPLSALAAALCAALLGIVVMRARGHAFVIITIALLFMAQLIAINWASLTGGTSGLSLPLPRWDRDYQRFPFYYSMLALLVLAVLLSAWIRKRKLGTGLIAIREDEGKATTIGIDTTRYKVLGFVASVTLTGAAGGVYGYYIAFIDPLGMFNILTSVEIVLAGLLGGRGTVWGPIVGAFILEPVNEWTNARFGTSELHLVIFGLLLIAVVLFLPNGIVPAAQRLLHRLTRRSGSAEQGQAAQEPGPEAGREPGGGPDGEPADAAAPATVPAAIVVSERQRRPDEDAGGGAASAPGQQRTLLELRGVSKRFGGIKAVDDCSFTVAAGSVTGLIGPNGSGKTTIFNLVSGTARPDGGEIWFDGRRIDRDRAWERAWLGLGRTFQATRLLKRMTVMENVVAPLRRFSWQQLSAGAISGPEAKQALELLNFVGMEAHADSEAGHLSFGQQKLVELAQVLMLEPKLVLLDEPAGGVNPRLVDRITELVTELNREGVTFLIVEHNMPLVLSVCDPVVVVARGRGIASGSPARIQADPLVLDAYLGEGWGDGHGQAPGASQRVEV